MAFKFQTKIGQGYLAVEADDYDNFYADLAQAFGQASADAMITAAVGTDLTHVPEPKSRAAAPAASSGGSPAPAASSGPAGLPADWKENPPSCPHGQRRARQWERGGKDQYTWFCPLPQDRKSEQCTPVDASNGKEWGAR